MKPLWIVLAALVALSAAGQAQPRPKRVIGGADRIQRPQRHPWAVADELPPALKLALNAVGRIRYSGTRVIEARVGANRQAHTEYVTTDGANSRIEFPANSPLHGQVIVETASERRQYYPARKEIQVGPPQRDEAFIRLAAMVKNRNVTVTEAAGGSIAGLQTEVVSISSRKGDLLQRLWIDPIRA